MCRQPPRFTRTECFFPTQRSSDLSSPTYATWIAGFGGIADASETADADGDGLANLVEYFLGLAPNARSEENTSELKSLMRIANAVFCLKKKTEINNEKKCSKQNDTNSSY